MVELRHLSVWVPAHLHFNILDWHDSVIYVFLSQTQTATADKKHENQDFSFRIKGKKNGHWTITKTILHFCYVIPAGPL